MSGRSARGRGGSDREAIACVVCVMRIRASACLFFSVGALWPVACGVPCSRTKWPAKTRAPAACFCPRSRRFERPKKFLKRTIPGPTEVGAGHWPESAPTEKRGKLVLEFLLYTLHTRSLHDRTHHPHARCVHSHRPNASSRPQGWHIRRIDGRRLAADTTRERHGSSARGGSSRMSLSTLRARAMELISRGMEQNLRRSARATYLENAYRSSTHRVLSNGAEMDDELATRARVCDRAAADLSSVPWHPMPRLGDRAA